jgi:hypothetical protein
MSISPSVPRVSGPFVTRIDLDPKKAMLWRFKRRLIPESGDLGRDPGERSRLSEKITPDGMNLTLDTRLMSTSGSNVNFGNSAGIINLQVVFFFRHSPSA